MLLLNPVSPVESVISAEEEHTMCVPKLSSVPRHLLMEIYQDILSIQQISVTGILSVFIIFIHIFL